MSKTINKVTNTGPFQISINTHHLFPNKLGNFLGKTWNIHLSLQWILILIVYDLTHKKKTYWQEQDFDNFQLTYKRAFQNLAQYHANISAKFYCVVAGATRSGSGFIQLLSNDSQTIDSGILKGKVFIAFWISKQLFWRSLAYKIILVTSYLPTARYLSWMKCMFVSPYWMIQDVQNSARCTLLYIRIQQIWFFKENKKERPCSG